ncbi:HAD family hydrolase [Candidatus Bathyarchaeota archaeon]|nr:MAG: HAD family hydrolase [Candidatus Bathyarchaeota archaeon]
MASLFRCMRKIKTVVFDVSGVLIDDIHAVWKADAEAYQTLGLGTIESIQKFRETFMMPVAEYHRAMGVPDELVPKLEEEYRRAYAKHNKTIRIFPEVKKVLTELEKQGMILAIASNVPSNFLKEHLERFGIDKYFATVTGQDDCVEQKPSPQPILVTLKKVGTRPEYAAYIGDMEEDIIAGKRAGVRTIAVSRDEGYNPRWRLERQSPDYIISNLNELLLIINKINRTAQNV